LLLGSTESLDEPMIAACEGGSISRTQRVGTHKAEQSNLRVVQAGSRSIGCSVKCGKSGSANGHSRMNDLPASEAAQPAGIFGTRLAQTLGRLGADGLYFL